MTSQALHLDAAGDFSLSRRQSRTYGTAIGATKTKIGNSAKTGSKVDGSAGKSGAGVHCL